MTIRTKKELISVREAAQECGRNMETIRRWIWGGKLPAEKLGNQLFIKRSDFTSFCRETATRKYKAEPETDFLERAIALRNRMKARGVKPINAAEEIRKMREERMNELSESDMDACPVFTRWQVLCKTCGVYFYVDTEPYATKEDFINLEELKCGEHPREDHCLELA